MPIAGKSPLPCCNDERCAVNNPDPDVTRCGDLDKTTLPELLARYHLTIHWVEHAQPIPGSHFGEPEAGLIGSSLYLRDDTPVHSALHEACHFICMDEKRRAILDTDAGGDYDEENAVCYLSILLANRLEGYGQDLMMRDMDSWGYTFRLGSARQWFEQDAGDARNFLALSGVIDKDCQLTWKLRGQHNG